MFARVNAIACFCALITCALSQAPVQLATPGAPPDVVAAFVGADYVGAVSGNGVFTFQGSGSIPSAATGSYLSHTCNPDGSWDAVWSVDTLDPTTGALSGQMAYCEHGSVSSTGTYTSQYMMGTTCPLTDLAAATTRTVPELSDSNLGGLLGTPYCNTMLSSSGLVHAPAAAPGAAPTPIVSHPGPGTTSIVGGSSGGSGTSDGMSTTGTP